MPPSNLSRPNVIWIFGDQHRGQALGSMGDPNLHTPHLDRLAAEGVQFTRASANCPLCCPMRGTLLTSRYPHECVPGHQYQLPPQQPTIAHAFNDAGYHTAYLGKWHLDGFHEKQGRAAFHVIPPERRGGFGQWLGYENNNSPWDCWLHGDAIGGQNWDAPRRADGFETDALTDIFIAHLNERARQPQQPFFAVLSVQPPHNPYAAPSEWMGRHTPAKVELRPNVPRGGQIEETARRELAGYYAMIENLDWNVGRIREALFESGLWENTHIIFFSDHGDSHGSQGQFRKTSPWQEAAGVPLIISGGVPFYGAGGGRSDAPVSLVDLAPTTLGLCGLEAPAAMRGTDLSGWRRRDREKLTPDAAFLSLVVPTGHGDSVNRPWRGLVTGDGWKYVELDAGTRGNAQGVPWLMFNLNDDPFEQANQAHNSRFAGVQRRLQERLAAHGREVGDAFGGL